MATSYEAAVSELYQAPLSSFVEERKRLADFEEKLKKLQDQLKKLRGDK